MGQTTFTDCIVPVIGLLRFLLTLILLGTHLSCDHLKSKNFTEKPKKVHREIQNKSLYIWQMANDAPLINKFLLLLLQDFGDHLHKYCHHFGQLPALHCCNFVLILIQIFQVLCQSNVFITLANVIWLHSQNGISASLQ